MPNGEVMAGYGKPTKYKHMLRIREARRMVANGYSHNDIVMIFREKYKITSKSVTNYITKARQQLIDNLEKRTKKEIKSSLVELLYALLQENISPELREKVIGRLVDIFGIKEPQYINHKMAPDNEWQVTRFVESAKSDRRSMELLLELDQRLHNNGGSNGSGNGDLIPGPSGKNGNGKSL